MPVTINVGLSKKIGQPDYGSLGASCNVQFETDHALLESDLDAFQRKIKHAFVACNQAVNDELARHRDSEHAGGESANGHARGNDSRTNGHRNGSSNGQVRSTPRRATASQVRAIHAIADRLQLDLAAELSTRFGAERAEDLSITDASSLIDELKGLTNGVGGHR